VFPIFEPKPKFADSSPLMRPLPSPIAPERPVSVWQWPALGAAILAWPFLLAIARPFAAGGTFRARNPRTPDAETGAPRAPSTAAAGVEPVPAIAIRGLTKRFGKVTAVADLNLEVRAGETVALWGPNGAAKTTVLRCLLGLFPCQGTAHVLGHPCGPWGKASRRQLGYVPQEVRLHADCRVRDTARFYARLRRVPDSAADRLIDDWGLRAVESLPVRHLSGGMKQKLALVVALLADPPILLLDEPTSNLDPRSRREFGALLQRLKATGKTLLFCTHRSGEVRRLADRVIVLEHGAKIAEGPPDSVRPYLSAPRASAWNHEVRSCSTH
jgi:ABC-type multidrug transport system ATPase subunit